MPINVKGKHMTCVRSMYLVPGAYGRRVAGNEEAQDVCRGTASEKQVPVRFFPKRREEALRRNGCRSTEMPDYLFQEESGSGTRRSEDGS